MKQIWRTNFKILVRIFQAYHTYIYIMLLLVYTLYNVLRNLKYFLLYAGIYLKIKLKVNTTTSRQSDWRNFSGSLIKGHVIICLKYKPKTVFEPNVIFTLHKLSKNSNLVKMLIFCEFSNWHEMEIWKPMTEPSDL